ncbi:MAG: putative lipid II flippase FtsW [Lachnospiraceae bacterium]|nr:putative lipid II flippase FtsW [Lachnospiraceae bacterium]
MSHYDVSLILLIIFLCVFGLIMIYSTSYYNADHYYNDEGLYITRQALFFVGGLVAMILISMIDYHVWFKEYHLFKIRKLPFRMIWILWLLCIGLQFYVWKFGYSANGSSRWIRLGALGNFQPSELTKICFVMMTAYLCVRNKKKFDTPVGFVQVIGVLAFPLFLVAKLNLSSAIIMAGIMIVICFVMSRKKWYYYICIVPVVLGGIAYFVFNEGYRAKRIVEWLHPENDPGSQIMQGLYAIASGGFFGKGLGNSVQKMGYIQEVHTDMIFTVICEEFGIIGAIAVITVFLMLLLRLFKIAINSSDMLGGLIATGVFVQIAIQLVLNIAVVTNTIPATGVPLPFISYGGSSLLVLMAEMGIVLSVSKYTVENVSEE